VSRRLPLPALVALVALVAAGCAGEQAEEPTTAPDSAEIALSGDRLVLADGTIVRLSIVGELPPPCGEGIGNLLTLPDCIPEGCEEATFRVSEPLSEAGPVRPGRAYVSLHVRPWRCE
jgi:hypothetical protein